MTAAARRCGRQQNEPDVRIRPNKGSRSRTKGRPSHADAQRGMVIAKDRSRWGVVLDNIPDIAMTCMHTRELGYTNIVIGDRVGVTGDVGGREGMPARVVKLAERNTVLRRTADDNDPYERITAASADLLLIVYTVTDSESHTDFVERALVAAYVGDVRPVLCLTKSDLVDPQEFVGEFSALGVDVVVCGIDDNLVPLLEPIDVPRRMTTLVGHSDVDKSTLVNRIVPEASRETGEVSGASRGHHTSTQLVALMLPSESTGDATSWTINIPDIHSPRLAHMTPETLLVAFPGIRATTDECLRGCTHLEPPADPECALDKLEGTQYRRAMAVRHLLSAIDDNEDWELDIERD